MDPGDAGPIPDDYDEQWHILNQFPSKSSYRTLPTIVTNEKSITGKAGVSPSIEGTAKIGKSIQKAPFEMQMDIEKSTIYSDQSAFWNYEFSSDCKDIEHDLQMSSHRGQSVVYTHCLPTSIEASILASFEITEAGSKSFFRPETICGIPIGFRHVKTRLQAKVKWDMEECAKFPGEKSAIGGASLFLKQQFRGGCGTISQYDEANFDDCPGMQVTLALGDLGPDVVVNEDVPTIRNSITSKKWGRRLASLWSV